MKRYGEQEEAVDVMQPFCFYQYHQEIGGVDLLDRFVSHYTPIIIGGGTGGPYGPRPPHF